MIKFVLVIFLLLAIPSTSFASSSSVSVKNQVNTSNSNNGTNNSEVNTDIRVEQDGEVTTYTSDKAEDIEVNVEDGKSEIKVDGEIVDEENEPTGEKDEQPSTNSAGIEDKIQNENRTMFQFIQDLFKSIFSLLV